MAKENKQGWLTRWIEKNKEKVLGMLHGVIEDGESIEYWVMGETAPTEILDWLPILDWIHHAMTKNYVLCLTDRRLLVIRTKGVSTKVLDSNAIPLSEVRSIEDRQWPMTAHVIVALQDGSKTTYKEVIREEAKSFAAEFETLRA